MERATAKERPNKTIRKYVESKQADDWEHRQRAAEFYALYDTFRRFLFAPENGQKPLPQAVIAIEQMRVDTLAAYRLVPNAMGLPWEISLNAKYLPRPIWEQAESLLHETVHLYQEDGANNKRDRFFGEPLENCRRAYHNQQFVSICEEVGLHPILGLGAHWRPGDGQFASLMERLSYEMPDHAKSTFTKPEGPFKGGKTDAWWFSPDRGRARGSSSLTLYECETCPLPSPCKVRSGRKNLHLGCTDCGGSFLARI